MSILRRLEKRLDERMRGLFAPGAREGEGRELIEIHRGILDDAVNKAPALRRGKRIFPYNRLIVHIPVTDPERRGLFEAAFSDGSQLSQDIREVFADDGIQPPRDLAVEVVLSERDLPEAAGRGFHTIYQKRDPSPTEAAAAAMPAAEVVIYQGADAQPGFLIEKERINIGRLTDVLDEQERLVRRNDIAFDETAGRENATVSRAHAHIRFDRTTGEFRLFDDGSSYGTSVFRDGSLIRVPGSGSRGLALRHGDEIYFGQARARFQSPTGRES
jgi:hypothetical protein